MVLKILFLSNSMKIALRNWRVSIFIFENHIWLIMDEAKINK